jgi:hypothetical protein
MKLGDLILTSLSLLIEERLKEKKEILDKVNIKDIVRLIREDREALGIRK